MRDATELLVQYARYHRDQRNIATHLVGIPLIVFAFGVLFARPEFHIGSLELTPAWIAWVLASSWYLTRGNLTLGVAVSLASAALLALAQPLGSGGTAGWLGWACAAFAIGALLQFVGHYYEGRRPGFIVDPRTLLVGPMFVTGEALFALGWRRSLLVEIEKRAGPTHLRDLAHPVG